jgi:hypothetical protein
MHSASLRREWGGERILRRSVAKGHENQAENWDFLSPASRWEGLGAGTVFIAVYRWRVKPGKEAQFREGWRRGTAAITRIYGSHGSRLCQDRDGRFVGVAEWPDADTWQKAFAAKMVYDDPEARAMFLDALEPDPAPAQGHSGGGFELVFAMEVLDDLLDSPGR